MKHVIVIAGLLVSDPAARTTRLRLSPAPMLTKIEIASRRLTCAVGGSLRSMRVSIPVAVHLQFAYDQSVDVKNELDRVVSRIAAAIGEPARARMLYCLMDGHARTSTELAMVGEVSPSTASVHLSRLSSEQLVKMQAQGKHRYYALDGPNVASALESLSVLAGRTWDKCVPNTPGRLRTARTCCDHLLC